MTEEFQEKLIETLELIVGEMPIGRTDTHRAREKVERLREMFESSKSAVKAGNRAND